MHARKAVPYGRDAGAAARAAAPPLRAAYPKVSRLRLAFTFDDGEKPAPSSQVHIMHPAARAYFKFACPAAGCNGEFELGPTVERLVRLSELKSADFMNCVGVRAEHRVTGAACGLHLKYQIEITY